MKYQLTCLTPTLIGDGEELAPIDYMVWKDQINVLDQKRIFRLFARGPRLDGYLLQLKKATKLDFASWGGLAQNYAGRRIPFEHASLTKHWDRTPAEYLFIRTFANVNGGPYVPGTAIKGALRTGSVFANWNDNAWKSVNEQVERERIPRRLSVEADERLVGRRLHGLGASDSEPLAAANSVTRVYMLRTAALASRDGNKTFELGWKRAAGGSSKSADDSTPAFVEMAQPGTTFSGLFRAKHNGAPLLEAANKFTAGLLEVHAKYAERARLGKLAESIAALQRAASEAAASGNSCLLPLGWGGGFLGKAAITDSEQDAVRQVLRKLPFYQRAIQTGLPFPKTRRIVFLNDAPATLAGWTRLTIEAA